MNIYLIRHGQTDWNIAGKIQGSSDIPLNETGLRQAENLADGMKKCPVTQIFSSNLKRAIETARAIGKQQQIVVQQVDGLEEVGFGEWEGLTWQEVRERYPREYQLWWLNPVNIAPPGGELQQDIWNRCKKVTDAILGQAKGDIAIVSHGATLAYLLEYLMRDNPLEERILVDNASITTIQYSPLSQDFVMMKVNDSSHLY